MGDAPQLPQAVNHRREFGPVNPSPAVPVVTSSRQPRNDEGAVSHAFTAKIRETEEARIAAPPSRSVYGSVNERTFTVSVLVAPYASVTVNSKV